MNVLVVTAMYPSDEKPYFGTFVRTQVESLRSFGVAVETMVIDGRSRKLMYLTAGAVLRRRLASGGVDLVHAHYGYVIAAARCQRTVPVVATFHGDDLLGTVDEAGRTKRLSRAVATGGRRLARHVDAAIVQTRQMAQQLEGLPHVSVIPMEIDLDRFRPLPRDQARAILGLDVHTTYLLFAASPDVAVKRYPLARAAADIVRLTDPTVELLVVGREPQHRLALYFNACDVLVFTSFQEGSPNVVKQAMACNLPIVSTDVGDVREVTDGVEGCAIAEPTAEAVASAINRLRRGGRSNGRARAGDFSRETITPQVVAVYRDVLARSGSHLVGTR